MINKLIEWSLKNRFLVACGTLLLIGWGIRSIYLSPVDAIPDLSENQVIVFADWPGRSPQEVEDQVTYPLSVNLQGLAGVKTVRANSMFGFTLITVIFEDAIDNYFARSRVLERLNYLGDVLPAGVIPKLGPDATGLGWVYQYYLEVDPSKAGATGYDLGQLRALQDWFIRYQLNAVQGVAEVGSVGGFVRQYQIEVSSTRMRSAKVSLQDVMKAVGESNLCFRVWVRRYRWKLATQIDKKPAVLVKAWGLQDRAIRTQHRRMDHAPEHWQPWPVAPPLNSFHEPSWNPLP